MNSGIYEILNTANGKRYIGSAINFAKRFLHHKHKLRNNVHHNRHLQAAWNKYGEVAFIFSPIIECAAEERLSLEQALLDSLRPEYNKALVADAAMEGRKHSEETKRRMSAAQIGKKNFAGHKHTAETIAKLSRPKSLASRAKMSDAQRGNKKALGHKHTPEFCAAITARQRGRHLSQETREKLAAANRGKKQSPETIAKRAAAMRGNTNTRGHKLSEAHKAKISEGLRKSVSASVSRELVWASNRGRVHTPEARNRMAVAAKAREARKRRVSG